jgi:hypothetical protein
VHANCALHRDDLRLTQDDPGLGERLDSDRLFQHFDLHRRSSGECHCFGVRLLASRDVLDHNGRHRRRRSRENALLALHRPQSERKHRGDSDRHQGSYSAARITPYARELPAGIKGHIRLLESPHTQENYLQKEMGFKVARKHAAKLRQLAIAAGFVAPVLLITLANTSVPATAAALSVLAVPVAAIGVLIERWLFFAEAKHVVTLYYGETTA